MEIGEQFRIFAYLCYVKWEIGFEVRYRCVRVSIENFNVYAWKGWAR